MASHVVDISEVLLQLGLSSSATDEERAVCTLALRMAEGEVRRHLRYDPLKAERTEFYPQRSFQQQFSGGVWEVMEQRAVLRTVSEAATNELQLRHLPLRGSPVVSVRVDYDGRSGTPSASFPAESLKSIGTDYWPNYDGFDASSVAVCRDGILRTIGLWPTQPGSVKVVYTAGFTTDELRGSDPLVDGTPVWEACLIEAVRRARRALAQKKGSAGWLAGPLTSENLGDYSYSADGASIARLFGGALEEESREKLSPFVNYGWDLGA